MYLTASRPDITFAVCACARFQVTPKTSHLQAVKRIFRYLKDQPKLGLWYLRDSPFDLEAFSDNLKFVNQHNMVACLEKIAENAEFHQIEDFLSTFISESSVRSDLLFNDKDGIACLTNNEICENLALIGYEKLSTKLTFQKGLFSPQWKILIHTILQCISSKSTAWNEFSTNLASAFICLANGQKFNFSKLIFDGMLRNLDPKRFLMYPRFLQLFLNNQLKDLPEPFNDTYETPTHSKNVISNMARKSKKFSRKITPLFDFMLVQNQAPEGEGSAIPPEPQPTPSTSQPNVSEPQNESLQTETPPTVSHEHKTKAHIEQILPSSSTYQRKQRKTQKHRRAKKVTELPQTSVPLDHGADKAVHKEGVTELIKTCTSLTKRVLALEEAKTAQDRVITRLKLRVKRIEKKRKARTLQPMKRRIFKGRFETYTDKSLGEDASKQGRNDDKIEELNLTDGADTKVIVEDKGSGEKCGSTADQVSTTRPEVSAASVPVNVSAATPSTPPTTTIFDDEDLTIAQTLVKMRSEKAMEKEKGVVLIDEKEPPRLNRSTTILQPLPTIDSKDKAKELAQRLHEEELAELDRAQKERQKQEEATSAALAKEFDEIQAKIDADHEMAVRLTYEEPDYDDSQQQAESTKKRPRADSEEESSKKPKLEEDTNAEKEKLRDSMDVAPRDDVAIDVESLATKYPIADWKTHILNENMIYYQIIKADGSSKNYKIFSEMFDDFDRQDVIDLHMLVNERYEITSP
ncbi:hypothetical protein Tco_0194138 [Tanacetum coccineum]